MWTRPLMNSPAPAPAAEEIEVYKRRYIPILFFLLSLINVYFIINAVCRTKSYAFKFPLFWTILMVSLLGAVQVVYTLIFLVAPRFLYKGTVWLKASPWIISTAGLFIIFLLAETPSVEKYIYCISGLLAHLAQFFICIMETETPISFLLKPFEKVMVPNLLGKINLSDPNADLNTIFGPPVQVSSQIPGQRSAIVRYGSQAIKKNKYPLAQSLIQVPLPSYQQQQQLPAQNPPSYSNQIQNENTAVDFKK